jgi:hypothetical protein
MMTTYEVVTTPRVFEIVMVNMNFPHWAIAEQGVDTTSHLFRTSREAFNALLDALEADPEVKVYNI